MSNFPRLSEEAADLLVFLTHIANSGSRPAKSKAREELRRAGLIYSRPPNHNPVLPAVCGHARRWYVTGFGREVGEAIADERREGLSRTEAADIGRKHPASFWGDKKEP